MAKLGRPPKKSLQMEKLELLEEQAKRKAKENYLSYFLYANPTLILGDHIRYIINEIQELLDGKLEEDILILSLPPQHGKTETVTKTLPAFVASQGQRVIIAGYNDDLANEFNADNIRKIEECNVFDIKVTRKTADTLRLSNGGSILSRGIRSGITGRPADLVVIDDPIKGYVDAYSETTRNTVWQEFQMSIRSRLSANAKIILIQTRWHEDDLAGRIIANPELSCKVVNIPCIAMENDIIGREVGEGLFPEIGKDTVWAEKYKRSYLADPNGGQRAWNALYQGMPSDAKGDILKKAYWKYYKRRDEFVNTMPLLVMSVDATFKDTTGTDKCSIQIWGKKQAQVYLVDNITKQMSFTETLRTIKLLLAKYPSISAKFVEDKANGPAIINMLNQTIGGFIPVKADRSTGGKVARVMAIEPFVSSGNVYLPEDSDFTFDFVEECAKFPNGKNDDQVDAMSQALNKLIFYYAGVENQTINTFDEFMGKRKKKDTNDWCDDTFADYGF